MELRCTNCGNVEEWDVLAEYSSVPKGNGMDELQCIQCDHDEFEKLGDEEKDEFL